MNKIYLGKFKYAKGGLVRLDEGGEKDPPKKSNPIYVDSANDPRYRAYADSLSLYNNSQRRIKDFNEFATANNLRTYLSGEADYFPIEHPTIGPIKRTGFIYREDNDGLVRNDGAVNTQITPQAISLLNRGVTSMNQITIYKKPVQPVEVRKRPSKLTPKEATLPTSNPEVVKSYMRVPDNPNIKQTFGSTSGYSAGSDMKSKFQGNFNLETGEWSFKEKKPVNRELTLTQPFKEGGWMEKYQTAGQDIPQQQYGGDISVPDLRRVVIKKVPSWKKS